MSGREATPDSTRFAVSVVMATYNGERHVEAQLRSFAAQSFLPTELVVGDDGSSDATLEIVERFAASAPFPVTIRRNERNLGFGDNFLETALLAKSRWIAFSDQDDEWEPEKLHAIREAVTADPAVLLVAHPSRLVRNGKLTEERFGPQTPGTFEALTMHPLDVINGHALAFRRELLEVLPPESRPISVHSPARRMPHDDWITFLGNALGRTVILGEPLVRYRMHDENVSGAQKRRKGLLEYRRRGILSSLAEVEKLVRAAGDRAKQLRAIDTEDTTMRTAAHRAASYYDRLVGLETQRLQLWRASSRPKRLLIFGRLVVSGGYRGFQGGGLSKRDALKDFLFGLLRGSRSIIPPAPRHPGELLVPEPHLSRESRDFQTDARKR